MRQKFYLAHACCGINYIRKKVYSAQPSFFRISFILCFEKKNLYKKENLGS
jgi:hypothetical protein